MPQGETIPLGAFFILFFMVRAWLMFSLDGESVFLGLFLAVGIVLEGDKKGFNKK